MFYAQYVQKYIVDKPNNLFVHPQENPFKKRSPSTQKRMERQKAAWVEAADEEAEETPNSTFSNKDADIDTATE